MDYTLKKLKNNLNTLLIDAPGSTSACAQIWFRAGSALESKENEGIAHFLEHMFFKGTATRPGAMIAHEVESFGGEINAFTSFDYTCYYINTPNSELNETIDIIMDMVSNPEFKQEELTPERDVVFEEYRRSIDNPGQYSFHKIQKSSFTGGYAHPILGREDTIKNFSRKQLKEFRSKFYNSSNAMLVVAGDLNNKKEILSKIEKYEMPLGLESEFPKFKLKTKNTIEVHKKDVEQCQLTITIQAPNYTDKAATTEELAMTCIGNGETSLMYKEFVLDNSMAMACTASTMFMNKGGVHFIRVVFPHKNTDKILSKLNKIIVNLRKEGIDKKDIQKVKNQYVASKIFEKETIESYAFSLGHSYAQTGDINSENNFIDQIKKCSENMVNESYEKIFSRPMHISLQIPDDINIKKSKETLDKFLKKVTPAKKKALKKEATNKVVKSKYDPQLKKVEIIDGISLLHRHNPIGPTFVMHAYLRGGLTEEKNNNNGIYQILSGLLTKGYSGQTYEKLKNDIENMSASLHGFSGKNAYGLTMHGLSQDFSDLTNHFFGSLISPTLPAKFLKHEKEQTLRSIVNQTKDPVRVCFKEVNDMFFNGHPYQMSTLGNEKSIKGLSRIKLQELHTKNIAKKEILITYCGDLELEEIVKVLKEKVKPLRKRTEKIPKYKSYKPITNITKKIEFDREQTNIFIGFPTKKLSDNENVYLKMITTHLSGQSSELFVEVRDKQGLCYSAQPIHFSALEGGYFGIYMASGFDKTERAIDAINKIMDNIKSNGISKIEFLRIKKMIQGQSLISIQTNEDYANIYSVPTLQGQGMDYYYKKNEAIDALTYDMFQTNIKKILSRKRSIITVGR